MITEMQKPKQRENLLKTKIIKAYYLQRSNNKSGIYFSTDIVKEKDQKKKKNDMLKVTLNGSKCRLRIL